MKQVEMFKWWLPPAPWAGPRAKPYLSSFLMTADDAAKRGAIRPEPGTRWVHMQAETPEEEAQVRRLTDTAAIARKS
jgi:hypothetical protein